MQRLHNHCAVQVKTGLTPATAFSWLAQADTYGLQAVRAEAFAFAVKNRWKIKKKHLDTISALKGHEAVMQELLEALV